MLYMLLRFSALQTQNHSETQCFHRQFSRFSNFLKSLIVHSILSNTCARIRSNRNFLHRFASTTRTRPTLVSQTSFRTRPEAAFIFRASPIAASSERFRSMCRRVPSRASGSNPARASLRLAMRRGAYSYGTSISAAIWRR